jgi:ferric-dicitrate binding protein FerR (iron transport regulator)
MENKDLYKDFDEEKEKEFFSKVKVGFTKSKEDVWSKMEVKLNNTPEVKPQQLRKQTKVIAVNWKRYSIAASIAILFGLIGFMKFYTVEFNSVNGDTLSLILPDNSEVLLNGESSIQYNPYWWSFNRQLSFEGEAFFEVEKGSEFTVFSKNGTTQVLGTSFNILAEDDIYEVFCKTGKVKVSGGADFKIIFPGTLAVLSSTGKIEVSEDVKPEEILDWRTNEFIFNTTPLIKVIRELERHYNVTIVASNLNLKEILFSGSLSREASLIEVLESVCFSFNLHLEKSGDNIYTVSE